MSLKKNEASNKKAIKNANGNVGLTKKYGNKIGSQSNQEPNIYEDPTYWFCVV